MRRVRLLNAQGARLPSGRAVSCSRLRASLSDVQDTRVLPDFLEAYTAVCDLPTAKKAFATKADCVHDIIFPSVEIQEKAMAVFEKLNEGVGEITPSVKAVLLDCLVHKNVDGFNVLLQAYLEYMQSVEIIRTMMEAWHPIGGVGLGL